MKDIIKNIFKNKNGKISSKANLYLSKYEQEIISLTPNCMSDNLYERIHWILNNVYDYPKCKICGKDNNIFLKQSTRNDGLRYTTYCSDKCRAHDPVVIHKMQTCLQNKWILLMNELKTIDEVKQFLFDNYFVHEPRQSFKGSKINGNISRVITDNVKTLIDGNISNVLKTENYNEKIYWLLNDLKEYPRICKECDTSLKFYKGWGYNDRKEYCSNKCRGKNKDRIKNMINKTDFIARNLKSVETCKQKYGGTNVMHDQEIFDRTMLNQMKWKEYKLPSGNVIKIQGYENKALDELLTQYKEEEIILNRKQFPVFKYFMEDGSEHRYYPDMYIPKDNLIIEVKSVWTYSQNKEKNKCKFQTVKDNGYQLKVMIYEQKETIAKIVVM